MFDPEVFIARAPWQVAKTMPEIPHEYIVRWQMPRHEFEAFARHVLEQGRLGRWFRVERRYFDVGDHRYWVMTTDVSEAMVINRELITDSKVWFGEEEES